MIIKFYIRLPNISIITHPLWFTMASYEQPEKNSYCTLAINDLIVGERTSVSPTP